MCKFQILNSDNTYKDVDVSGEILNHENDGLIIIKKLSSNHTNNGE